MSKIHEIINNIEDNLLDNEDTLSSNEKDRILDMTLNKIPSQKNKKLSKRKLLIGILVATMMICTVTMAKEYFDPNLDGYFTNLLNIDKNNTSLSGAGTNLNQSITKNNLTVTVTQTLGDEHTLYILVDIIAPENMSSLSCPGFSEYDITLDKMSSSGLSIEEIEDENPKDNKYRFLMSYNTNSNLTRMQITLNLKDFGYFSDKKNDLIPLIKDNWELSWKLNYKNTSKKFKVNHFVKENKYKSIITNIEISPISISANLIGCSYDDFEIKSLTMKDGTIYSTTYDNSANSLFSGGHGSSSILKSYTSINFQKIINIDDIESVTIGNETIKLNN